MSPSVEPTAILELRVVALLFHEQEVVLVLGSRYALLKSSFSILVPMSVNRSLTSLAVGNWYMNAYYVLRRIVFGHLYQLGHKKNELTLNFLPQSPVIE